MAFEQIGKLEGEIKREVQLTLQPGCILVLQQIQGYEDFDPNREVLAMLRGGFGLKDAPRLWQLRLQQALERAGGRSLVSEPKLYVFEFQGQLQMIMSSHVDDLKGAGDDNTRSRVLKMLEQEFGKLKTQFGVFECIGIMHEQDEVTKEIWTHQHHYTRQLKTIADEQYKMCDGDQQVTGNTYTAYRSLLGGVAWLAQTMMPVCIYISYLQRRSQAPTVNDVKKLNRLLRWIKANLASLGVQYGRLQEPLQLLCISDSAFKAKEYDGLAMRGCVILLASAANDEKDKQDWKCIPLDWFAKKHTHVVRSTFAAELHSMLDAIGNALLLNLAFTEIQLGHVTIEGLAQMQEQGRLHLEVQVYTDAKSVYEAICADPIKVPTEKTLYIHLLVARDRLDRKVVTRLCWIDTVDMLADGLTKGNVDRSALIRVGKEGRWTLGGDKLLTFSSNGELGRRSAIVPTRVKVHQQSVSRRGSVGAV